MNTIEVKNIAARTIAAPTMMPPATVPIRLARMPVSSASTMPQAMKKAIQAKQNTR
ncbi:hypothetical protein D3C81_2270990 [compost metagenome]